MVFDKVILQRRSRESDTPQRLDLVDGLRDGGRLILQQMALVANDEVGTGVRQTLHEDRPQLLRGAGSWKVIGEIISEMNDIDE